MERELVDWLTAEFGTCRYARLGIGDDCAILPSSSLDTILTCDAICDGVHFLSTQHSPEQIGYKALAVNLSDLASMGATPRCVTISLVIPCSHTLEYVKRLFAGMRPLVDLFHVDICGGDTTVWDGGLVVSVSAIGSAPVRGAWRIDGAQPGNRILVTGRFGGSLLGHHLSFLPRCDFAKQWRETGWIQACTDVSDSLGIDLAKVARASGTGFVIDAKSIPVSNAAIQLAGVDPTTSALDHALCDGEDFELIVIAHPDHAVVLIEETPWQIGLTDIGVITSEPGFYITQGNENKPFQPNGYEHRLNIEKPPACR